MKRIADVPRALMTLYLCLSITSACESQRAPQSDRYMSADGSMRLAALKLDALVEESVSTCMRTAGLKYIPPLPRSNVILPPPSNLAAVRAFRTKYWYGAWANLKTYRQSRATTERTSAAFGKILEQCSASARDRYSQSYQQISKTADQLQTERERASNSRESRAAIAKWSGCMKAQGFDVSSPFDAVRLVSEYLPKRKDMMDLRDFEKSLAEADLSCLESLAPYFLELHAIEAQFVSSHKIGL